MPFRSVTGLLDSAKFDKNVVDKKLCNYDFFTFQVSCPSLEMISNIEQLGNASIHIV